MAIKSARLDAEEQVMDNGNVSPDLESQVSASSHAVSPDMRSRSMVRDVQRWGMDSATILHDLQMCPRWSEVVVLPFAGKLDDNVPFLKQSRNMVSTRSGGKRSAGGTSCSRPDLSDLTGERSLCISTASTLFSD